MFSELIRKIVCPYQMFLKISSQNKLSLFFVQKNVMLDPANSMTMIPIHINLVHKIFIECSKEFTRANHKTSSVQEDNSPSYWDDVCHVI